MDENAVTNNEELEPGENNQGGDAPSNGTEPVPTDPMLAALKTDLGIRSAAYDDRLSARIEAAKERIGALGISLADTEEDNDLVLMYAAWLWRSRSTGEGKPEMLRTTLYNRLFGEKARTS